MVCTRKLSLRVLSGAPEIHRPPPVETQELKFQVPWHYISQDEPFLRNIVLLSACNMILARVDVYNKPHSGLWSSLAQRTLDKSCTTKRFSSRRATTVYVEFQQTCDW